MNKKDFLNKYYNNKMQLHIEVVNDILDECMNKNIKMLVFGLGHDSKLWYNITNHNTFFVEHDQSYIDLNKEFKKENIIKYDYKNISVLDSYNMPNEKLKNYDIPKELITAGPFDIILIDGPTGWKPHHPGRLLPIYWSSNYLCKSGTIIYIDDSKRKLEAESIRKFLENKKVKHFTGRGGCDKFII